jgi:hypothetical protein
LAGVEEGWVKQALWDAALHACMMNWTECQNKIADPKSTWDLNDPIQAATYEAWRISYRTLLAFKNSGQGKVVGQFGPSGGLFTPAEDNGTSLEIDSVAWSNGQWTVAAGWKSADALEVSPLFGVVSKVSGLIATGCLVAAPLTEGVSLGCAGPAGMVSAVSGAGEAAFQWLEGDDAFACNAAAEAIGYLVPGNLDMPGDLPLQIVNSGFGNAMDFAC